MHTRDELALDLLLKFFQPVQYKEKRIELPKTWLVEALTAPEHIAEATESSWVFPSLVAFRDWTVSQLERPRLTTAV